MKVQFADDLSAPLQRQATRDFRVCGETDRLTDVLLCPPSHLEPVPCCAKTRDSMRFGFAHSTQAAIRQHRALREALTARGVACHMLPAEQGMPDLCFTRDTAVATPWGVVALSPAMAHRAPEVNHAVATIERITRKAVRRIRQGHVEGGDVCIARPGLLVLGLSGERTDEAGAAEFAAPFIGAGWDVVLSPFDPHFLHLDTIFCMLDRSRALACVDVLDDGFLEAIVAHGIDLVPTTYQEARDLGGNILSLDGRTIFSSIEHPRVSTQLRRLGYEVVQLEIAQFAAFGGGMHCLTMPLARLG